MEEQIPSARVRMNVTTNAKGKAQIDITAEFPTVEGSALSLKSAIKEMKKVLEENGLELAKEAK